jgi:hypothetical protein
VSAIRARVYAGPRRDDQKLEFRDGVNGVLDKAIGPENWSSVPDWKNVAQEIWHRIIHPLGIHWYITTMVWNREAGSFQTVGDLCWICPDTLPNLRRTYYS